MRIMVAEVSGGFRSRGPVGDVVADTGGGDDDGEQWAEGVGDDAAFAADDSLAGTATDVGLGTGSAPGGQAALDQGPAGVGQVAGIGGARGHVVQVASLIGDTSYVKCVESLTNLNQALSRD
jgi:hypothetical protein